MIFLIFCLSTIGLTNIIVHGKILDNIGLRPFLKNNLHSKIFELFECYECTGFWSGMAMGSVLISSDPFYFIPCGFAGSVLSSFYSELIFLLRSKTDFVVDDTNDEQTENKE